MKKEKEKEYEDNSDYILDVLGDAANESIDRIFDGVTGDTRHEFSKFLAIINEIDIIKDRKMAEYLIK